MNPTEIINAYFAGKLTCNEAREKFGLPPSEKAWPKPQPQDLTHLITRGKKSEYKD